MALRRRSAAAKSEYELLREKNIREKEEMLSKLMGNFKKLLPVTPSGMRTPKKRKHQLEGNGDYFLPHKFRRLSFSRSEPPVTRSRRSLVMPNCSSPSKHSVCSSTGDSSPPKLVVRFPFAGRRQLTESEISVFDEESSDSLNDYWCEMEFESRQGFQQPRIKMTTPNIYKSSIVPVSEITQHDLDKVADFVSEKVYSADGTTCHQCRQKTKDMKSICRSEECRGIRGNFCGPCLRNRYGEEVRDALLDPNWICPPCRGICNCSFCRKKAGHGCTGIMIHVAREKGYSSVKEYLEEYDD